MDLERAEIFCSSLPVFGFLVAKIIGMISKICSRKDDDLDTDAAREQYLAAQKHFKQPHLIRGLGS